MFTKKLKYAGLVGLALILIATIANAQGKNGRTVEEVVARVNNEIITKSEYDKAKADERNEVAQDCQSCTPAQINAKVAPLEKDLVRDMIDNLLLVQRAKDLGVNVDTDVIKQLDQIRQENHLESMEDLEKAMRSQGINYEDEKDQIRNKLYRDEVMRREIGSKIVPDKTEVQKYYDEHKSQFVRQEAVYVREIFISTEGKDPQDLPALRAKADQLLERVKNGEDFGQLAKAFSDAATKTKNGELGLFQRGMMPQALEDAVFKLKRNEVTPVIPIQTGFEILQTMEHYDAGQQPVDKVENEINNLLYEDKMKPALRDYLDKLREDSYIEVKTPFVDSAGVPSRPIEEIPAGADTAGARSLR